MGRTHGGFPTCRSKPPRAKTGAKSSCQWKNPCSRATWRHTCSHGCLYPPWVRPDSDVAALLAEGDPWWQLTDKPAETDKQRKRSETLALPGMTNYVATADSEVVAGRCFVGHVTSYPQLDGLRPDLYRCFMCQTWAHTSSRGTVGLVHPDR
jgi:hypothetical protein